MCLWSSHPSRWSPRTGLSKKCWATFTAQPNQWHCATSFFECFGSRNSRTTAGLYPNGKRPDGITTVPWQRGRCLAWDATYPDTFAPSHIQTSSIVAGAVAAEAETKKRSKYADLPQHIDFIPIAIETTGVWGSEGLDLVKELGRRIAIVQLEPRSTSFLRQRISLAIQRGNAYCIQATQVHHNKPNTLNI